MMTELSVGQLFLGYPVLSSAKCLLQDMLPKFTMMPFVVKLPWCCLDVIFSLVPCFPNSPDKAWQCESKTVGLTEVKAVRQHPGNIPAKSLTLQQN